MIPVHEQNPLIHYIHVLYFNQMDVYIVSCKSIFMRKSEKAPPGRRAFFHDLLCLLFASATDIGI